MPAIDGQSVIKLYFRMYLPSLFRVLGLTGVVVAQSIIPGASIRSESITEKYDTLLHG